MVETFDAFEAAAEAGASVGAVLLAGKPVYFAYEDDAEAEAKAFEIKHGRPPGEPEQTARSVVDLLRPGWLEASMSDLGSTA